MKRFWLILALAVGPLPGALHDALDGDCRHDGATLCSPEDHHDDCHICASIAGSTLDAVAVDVSLPVDSTDAISTPADAPVAATVDLARSRGPPAPLS